MRLAAHDAALNGNGIYTLDDPSKKGNIPACAKAKATGIRFALKSARASSEPPSFRR